MGIIRLKIYGIFAIAAFLSCIHFCEASEISSFRISQVDSSRMSIRSYLDISDESGNVVPDIVPGQLTATIGVEPAVVETIAPFDPDKDGVAYILLIDISKSLLESQLVEIRKALNAWIDCITERDRVLIMTFGTQINLVQDFTNEQKVLKSKVAEVKPTDNDTRLHLGLVKAMEYAKRTDPDLPSRRVIVTMSDGKNDFTGGMTEKEVIKQIEEYQVPIYAIGYYNPPYSPSKEASLGNLGMFSRVSGGEYYKTGGRPLMDIYAAIKSRIQNVYVADLHCPHCQRDGRVYRLQMTISSGSRSMTDGKDVRLFSVEKEKESHDIVSSQQFDKLMGIASEKILPKVPYIASGVIGLLLLMIVAKNVSRNTKKSENADILSHDRTIATPVLDPIPDQEIENALVTIRLTRIGGDHTTASHTIALTDAPVVIGRTRPGSDVIISGDDEISSRHCRFDIREGRVRVTDLESTNGTWVNGVPVTGEQVVENDDMLLLGRSEFRLSFIWEKE